MWSRARLCCRAVAASATISTVGPTRKVIWCAPVDSSNGLREPSCDAGARHASSSRSTPSGKHQVSVLPHTLWLSFWRGLALPAAGVAVLVTQLDFLITNLFPLHVRVAAGLGLLASLLDSFKDFLLADSIPCKKVAVENGKCVLGNGSQSSEISWVCASMRGWRPTMEDTHVATSLLCNESELGMFAVFDGHGGQEVSSIVQLLLPRMLEANMQNIPTIDDIDLSKILVQTVEEVDACLLKGPLGVGHLLPLGWLHPFGSVGCTSCVAIVDPVGKKIVVANTGDSRAILCRSGVAVPLSYDHKPEDPEEFKRIRQAGGTVMRYGPCFRVDAGLNLSRALGDFRYKANNNLPSHEQKIIARPDVVVQDWFPTSSDEFLVVACDGLFERKNHQQVVNHIREGLARGYSSKDILEELLHDCCARTMRDAGQDNETVILVQW